MVAGLKKIKRDGVTMKSNYHGGVKARAWRKRIGGLARRQKETVFTYKFPLETEEAGIDFDKAVQTYGIAEGISQGSLIGLVCAFHLSGFRLFSKADETKAFCNQGRYPNQAFAEKLRNELSVTLPKLSPQSLDVLFQSSPKSKNGVAPEWSKNAIRNRLYTNWTGKGAGTNPDEHLLEIAEDIAAEIDSDLDGWKDLEEHPEKGLSAADRYFQAQGDFPSLTGLPPSVPLTPQNSTVAFEGDPVCLNPSDNTLLHQAVARCAGRILQEQPNLSPDKNRFINQLQDELVSSQNNGLSWLFGVGFKYWKEMSVDQLADDYKVKSTDLDALKQVKSFIDAIPLNPLFDTPHYGEFRASVAGKMRSWVKNYWKRLLDLKSQLGTANINLPEGLDEQRAENLFSGLLIDSKGLRQVTDKLPSRLKKAEDTIDRLMGDGNPTSDDIEQVETVAAEISAFIGQVEQFNNQLEQRLENPLEGDDETFLKQLKIDLPAEFKKPPAINRISGGSPDPTAEIAELEEKLDRLMSARKEHYETIAEWASANKVTLDPMEAMTTLEAQRLTERGAEGDQEEFALRLLLQRIGRLANRLSPQGATAIRDLLRPVFTEKREFNLFFHNRMGSLYRSPYSTSRHQPFTIDVAVAKNTDWMDALDGIAETIMKGLSQAGDELSLRLRDWINISGFSLSQRLRGLPDTVPGELALVRSADDVRIPPMLALQLEEDEVSREVCLKAFNLYVSAINGCLFRALREGFIVRTKFQRLERDVLSYVPKTKLWNYPQRLDTARGPIHSALAAAWINKEGSVIDPVETVTALSDTGFSDDGIPEYLVQAPHDWYTPIDLRDISKPVSGLPVKKNITGLKRQKKQTAFRMVGPSSFKSHLDSTLLSEEVKLGDFTLIFDQYYKQRVSYNGRVKITFEPDRLHVEAAVPVIDKRVRPSTEEDALFDHLLAIDLGEKRVGYAVYDIKACLRTGDIKPLEDGDGKPIVGSVAVPSIRRLMKAVRSHRQQRQPNQKVNQTYSTALMNYRENVIGDVCNRIDTLMEKYNAFPVLESSVMNFEAGSRQLEMVYGSVLHRYTYSKIDAHTAKRKEYWYTGDYWVHPYLMAHEWNERTRSYSGSLSALTLYPGVMVHPAGTSQRCHQCKRNPMVEIKQLTGQVEINADGSLELDDGTICLYEASDYSPEEYKKAKREKRRLDPNVPLSGRHQAKHVSAVAKRNLRRPTVSMMSGDTTQARYVCLYTDCDFTGHADENAAINIGWKYLTERIALSESKDKAGV